MTDDMIGPSNEVQLDHPKCESSTVSPGKKLIKDGSGPYAFAPVIIIPVAGMAHSHWLK